MSEKKDLSILIQDLNSVPDIISSLGLGVAGAQKAFDLNYLEGLEKVILLAKQMLGNKEIDSEAKAVLIDMIKTLAPAKYQFTETSLTVKMDLAQSMQSSQAGSFGLSAGAVVVNAAFTQAFAYDYRAAAEVKVHINATSLDANVLNSLLTRVKDLDAKNLSLPADMPDFDIAIMEKSANIYKILTKGEEPEKLEGDNQSEKPKK